MKVVRLVLVPAAVVAVLALAFAGSTPASVPARADPLATVFAVQTRTAGDDDAPVERTPTPQPVAEEERPEGLPGGARPVEVIRHLDGDKLVIRSGGKPWEVLLIGLDAPEEDEGPAGECFADEAADRLVELAPRGATVYLEKGGDEVDDKDRLLRFLWVEDGGQALLANETLLREGFGSFDPREQNGAYDDELRAAEAAARDDGVGLWGECGENHVELPEEERAEVASAPEPDRDADGDGIAAADEQAESGSSTESDSVAATEEEQAYVDSFIEQSSDLSDSLGRFSELALDPKIGDQDWTIGIAVELAVWRSTYQEAQALPVPPAFTEIHAAYLEALSYLDSASYDIVTGLDTFDPQLLAQANANIVLGNERITEVRRLVDELREERGL